VLAQRVALVATEEQRHPARTQIASTVARPIHAVDLRVGIEIAHALHAFQSGAVRYRRQPRNTSASLFMSIPLHACTPCDSTP
jgi:hypothetical protein